MAKETSPAAGNCAGGVMGGAKETTFCFLDVETTGLNCRCGDRVCEIGMLKWQGGRLAGSYATLIDPEREISEGASWVNGITAEMVKGKPRFADVAKEILEFIGDSVIVCHNAPFDMGFLAREFERAGLAPSQNPVIDTLAVARKHYLFSDYRLETVAGTLGLEERGIHRALADVRLTCRVFEQFMKDFEKRGLSMMDEATGNPGAEI